jgi:hypothetical protein
MAICVGVIEEAAKFIPLALFIRNKSYFNEHTDGVIYFGIAGLTFGFLENVEYSIVSRNRVGGELTGIVRLIILVFFHAASTGIVGYYLAKAKIHKQSWMKPLMALGMLALVHGLYDFLQFYAAFSASKSLYSADGSGALAAVSVVGGFILSLLLNTFMFLYYRRAKQWDASIGLAVDPTLPPAPFAQPVPMAPVQPAVVPVAPPTQPTSLPPQ